MEVEAEAADALPLVPRGQGQEELHWDTAAPKAAITAEAICRLVEASRGA